MGLFSNKTRVSVGTSVVRVVEDETIPDSTKNSILEAVLTDTDLVPNILDSVLNSSALSYERAFAYAQRGNYHYGLPDVHYISKTFNQTSVKDAIEQETGLTITLLYVEYGPLNHTHMGWKAVTDTLGYNPTTNELETLTAQEGFPVYLDKIVPVIDAPSEEDINPEIIKEWGNSSLAGGTPERIIFSPEVQEYVSPTTFETSDGATESAQIHYIWEDSNGTIHKAQLLVDLTAYDNVTDFFQARYSYTDGQSVLRHGHWLYEAGAGTYLTVDSQFDVSYTNPGSYFPFLFFRRKGESQVSLSKQGTNLYLTSKELARYMGIDYQQLGEEIHDNPDISDVYTAAMIMGVPIDSTNPLDLRYLFDFFSRLHDQTDYGALPLNSVQRYTQNQHQNAVLDIEFNSPPENPYLFVVLDSDLKLYYSYGGTIKRKRGGSIGPVGTITFSTVTITYQYKTSREVNEDVSVITNHSRSLVNAVYRKQLTSGSYEEITVIAPSLRYDVINGYSTQSYVGSDKLLIPVDFALIGELTLREKEQFYNRSLHLIFNSFEETKVKWYEQASFVKFVSVVAAVITFITGGAASFLNALASALSAGLIATALFLIKLFIRAIVFRYLFKVTVKEVGAEVAIIAAIVLAASSIGSTDTGVDTSLLTADNLLVTSNGLLRGISDVLSDQFDRLKDETQIFQEQAEDALAELETAQELLETTDLLDPLLFTDHLQPMTLLGEAPSTFYERTIHTGNIGTIGVEYVESYVSIALTLPDLHQTVGGMA